MIGHRCSTVSLKRPWYAFHIVQLVRTLLYLAHPRFVHRRRSLVGRVVRCSTLLVNNLPITLNIKIDLCMCFTQTSVINLAPLPEQHSPRVMSPNSFYIEVTQISFLLLAAMLMSVENSQLRHAPTSPVPEDHGFQTARGRAASRSTSSSTTKSSWRSFSTTAYSSLRSE